jgi:DNA repair exonuclease SbcCD ATPase subunit
LQLEQENESNQREYERAKLAVIRSRFPNTDETSAFILARLISDAHCLVCGNHAPDQAINEYNSRIASVACVVCGTDLHGENNLLSGAEFADAAIASIAAKLASTAEQLESSEQTRTEAEQVFNESVVELATLDSNISARSARIDFLLRQLPPEESKRREQLSELSLLRRRLEELKLELTDKLTAFGTFVEAENRSIQEASDRIKTAFASFATGFLLEPV